MPPGKNDVGVGGRTLSPITFQIHPLRLGNGTFIEEGEDSGAVAISTIFRFRIRWGVQEVSGNLSVCSTSLRTGDTFAGVW